MNHSFKIFAATSFTSLILAEAVAAADIPSLVDKLKKGNPGEQVAAAQELGNAGKDAIPSLLDVIEHDKTRALPLARAALEKALQEPSSRTEDVRGRLINLSKKEDFTAASTAIDSLGTFDQAEADDAIADVAKSHPKQEVRTHAIRRLSVLKQFDRQAPMLNDLLKDPSPIIRDEAAAALGLHGDKSGLDAVLASLKQSKDKTPERSSSVYAAETLGDPNAIPVLEKIRDAEPPPEAHIVRAITVLKFKQLRDDDSRINFLRESLRKKEGNVDRWALGETLTRAKKSPEYKALLQEVASDPKHPMQRDAVSVLKNIK